MRYDELGEGEPGPLGGDRVEQTGGGRAGASPFGLIHGQPGPGGISFPARFTSADVAPMASVPRSAGPAPGAAARQGERGRYREPEAGVIGGVREPA